MRWFLSALLLFAVACDSPRTRPPGDRDAGTTPDAGGGQDAGPRPTGRILERTTELTHDCTVALDYQRLEQRSWSGSGWTHQLAEIDGSFTFGRIERTGEPFGQPTSVEALLSTLDTSGTFGTPTTLPAMMPESARSAHLGVLESGTMLFVSTTGSGASMVTVEQGEALGPKPIIDLGGDAVRAEVSTGHGRAAVLFGTRAIDDHVSYLIQPLDAAGAPLGSPTEIVRGAERYYDPGAALIATADGWAAIWYDRKTEGGEVYFRRFAMDGSPSGEVKTVYTAPAAQGGFGFAGTRIALLETSDGFVAAFTEGGGDWQVEENWVMVRVAKLDAAGEVLDLEYLADPELHFDWVEPELFWHGSAIGLTWGRGDHIYICGGCMPNHTIDLVLLDPGTLAPVSTPVKIENESLGGLLYRATASNGVDILSAFRVVYHVHSEAALGAFTCTAR